jgi:hypothetical protein
VKFHFALVLAKLAELEAAGGVLGVLGGGVVALMAASALQSHERSVALWH